MELIGAFSLCSFLLLASCQEPAPDKDWTVFEPIKDASKFDYCTLHCHPEAERVDDGLHPACFCWRVPPRTELLAGNLTEIIKLREAVVKEHNYLRNLSASGREIYPLNNSIPPAADMEIMNYDLELEHIARCRGINSFGTTYEKGTSHEPCKKMHDGRYVSQNLAYTNYLKNFSQWVPQRIQKWYNEVRYVPDAEIVDSYRIYPIKEIIGHWSTFMWHYLNRIGCVAVHHPDTARSRIKGNPNVTFILICDYASDYEEYPANLQGTPIFTRGEPCSACPQNHKCNSEYTALCGELHPVPTDPPFAIMENSARSWYRCEYSWWAVFLLNCALHRLFG